MGARHEREDEPVERAVRRAVAISALRRLRAAVDEMETERRASRRVALVLALGFAVAMAAVLAWVVLG